MSFFLGVLVGVVGVFVFFGLYNLYHVWATRYLLAKLKNELQQEFLDARQQILDDTIKQLEDHANED